MSIILGGGGSAEQATLSNRLFESLISRKKPILYIPLAMEPHKYESCFSWINNEFNSITHGDIVMVHTASEISNHNLSKYAAVFIGGGNTYKLLEQLKNTSAFEQIKKYIDNGGLVYGGSAGAIIFGKNINSCLYMDSNDINLKDTRGFNAIFGFSFTAHYTNHDRKATEYLTHYSAQEPVIALPEENSLYTDGNTIKVIGTKPWYIFNNGNKKQIEPAVAFTKDDFIRIVNSI